MIVVIQRVLEASISIHNQLYTQIGRGLFVMVGIEAADTDEDIEWLSKKIINLRILTDEQQIMNKSVKEKGEDILLVSQFTLQASTKKGNRPSYIKAAPPQLALPIYEKMITATQQQLGKPISTGKFGADMRIKLLNDGPVTIVIDTKNKV